MKKYSQIFIVIILLLLCFSTEAIAADEKLDDFEKDATKMEEEEKPTEQQVKRQPSPFKEEWTLGERIAYGFVDAVIFRPIGLLMTTITQPVLDVAVRGGENSWRRASGEDLGSEKFANLVQRKPGEPSIPFLRFDFSYQNVESDVDASDYRIEAGYGPIGFQIMNTHYQELFPSDRLQAFSWHVLCRMSYDKAEVDLGLGSLTLDGNNKNSGFSLTMPVLFDFGTLGLEYRPTFSWINDNPLADHNLAVLLQEDYVAIKAGYRWFKSENESLNGPFAGISFRF